MEEAVPVPQTFGSSLQVPYVQELVKEPLTKVPPRYLRPDQEPPFSCNPNLSLEIPIINMQKLLSGDFMDSELENLHQACKDWGFFQLRNHGVSTTLVENLKQEIADFFKLPMEEKKKYWQQPGDVEGYGQMFVMSEKTKLDWSDMFFMTTLPSYLRKPHLFPQLPLPLRDTLETYCEEMAKLAQKIIDQVTKALKMDPNDMEVLFEDATQTMRINYCPPCPQPELVIGLNTHSDASGLSILLQLNHVDGLQIKKDGMWVPIKPLPDAFIINIGDFLEIATNGIYRSIEHRATVNKKEERLSIATFHGLKMGGELGPAPSLITPETPALFRRISLEDYLKGFFGHEVHGKTYVDVMRVQNQDNKST